jgi:Carboxypeptidase regulatory-like domain
VTPTRRSSKGRALVACLATAVCLLALVPAASSAAGAAGGRQSSPAWVSIAPATSPRRTSGSSLRASASRRAIPLRALTPAFTGADGAIVGEVTSSVAGEPPIGGVEVCGFEVDSSALEEEEETPQFGCTETSAAGEYTLELPAGKYVVEFFASSESGLNYQTQFYKDVAQPSKATDVQVAAGSATAEINATLEPGGEITGMTTSAATNAPIAGVSVCAFDEAVESGNCSKSGSNGVYTVAGLATGNYKVTFITDPQAETTYVDQQYPGTVGVTVPETTPGIDVALRLTPPLPRSEPTIAGIAVAGQTLAVTHASWSNHPTSYLDKWLRCATVASTLCLVDGTGERYVLQPGDVGSVIRVKEWAFGASGESEPIGSEPTPIVLAAPITNPSTPPASTPPPPALGVLSSQSVKASTAQLRSLLASLLVPSGRSAKIAQLLKHRGYAVSFTALSAGKLTISWYLVPKGAHRKRVLVALGSVSSTAPGSAKLTIRLTANGESLLAHVGRLGLTASGLLRASGAPNLRAARSFTLRR